MPSSPARNRVICAIQLGRPWKVPLGSSFSSKLVSKTRGGGGTERGTVRYRLRRLDAFLVIDCGLELRERLRVWYLRGGALVNTRNDLGRRVIRENTTHASHDALQFVYRVNAVEEDVGVPACEVRSVDLRRRDADERAWVVEAKLSLDL